MTDKRISELDPATILKGADLIPIALEVSPGVYTTARVSSVTAQTYMLTLPVQSINTNATIQAGPGGVQGAVIRTNSISAVTLTIRKNNDTPAADFAQGNHFSVMQEGDGKVTLVGQTGNVQLLYGASFAAAATRQKNSIITATLYSVSGGIEKWVISGDIETPV